MLGERRDVRELERPLELRPRAGSVARVKQRLARAHARECSPPTAPTSRQSRAASTRCARPRGSSDHALGSAQSRGSGCAVRTIAFIRPRRVARSRRRHLAIAREMATVSANALGRCEAAPSRPKGRPGLARIERALLLRVRLQTLLVMSVGRYREPLAERRRVLDRCLQCVVFAVVGDQERQLMPQIVNLHLLGHAATEACVLIVERLGGGVDVNIRGNCPADFIDSPEVRVRGGQPVSGLTDQGRRDLWRRRSMLPGGRRR